MGARKLLLVCFKESENHFREMHENEASKGDRGWVRDAIEFVDLVSKMQGAQLHSIFI